MRSGASVAVDRDRLARAQQTLTDYKQGKAALENRVIEDEQWYKLRHWEYLRRRQDAKSRAPEPTSAWLFNSIGQQARRRHGQLPQFRQCCPGRRATRQSAKMLSDILPVVLERTEFEQVYSDNWWEKLKHGTAVYGVFWDSEAENGLGDVAIRHIDLLNIFWEPGVEDIQQSRNLFIVSLVDQDLLAEQISPGEGRHGRPGHHRQPSTSTTRPSTPPGQGPGGGLVLQGQKPCREDDPALLQIRRRHRAGGHGGRPQISGDRSGTTTGSIPWYLTPCSQKRALPPALATSPLPRTRSSTSTSSPARCCKTP